MQTAIAQFLTHLHPATTFLPSTSMMPSVIVLRPDEYQIFDTDEPDMLTDYLPIRFHHIRYHFEELETKQDKLGIYNKGGATIAYRINPHLDLVDWAISFCSLKDNFCRKLGRTICKGRFEQDLYFANDWPGDLEGFLKDTVYPYAFRKMAQKWMPVYLKSHRAMISKIRIEEFRVESVW